MGWWNQDNNGNSLIEDPTGLVWGDRPADIIDGLLDGGATDAEWAKALQEIREEYQRIWQRDPTRQEIVAGILFSLSEVRVFVRSLDDGPAPAAMQSVPGMRNVGPIDDEEWEGLRLFTNDEGEETL
jgi:hypothetical protein